VLLEEVVKLRQADVVGVGELDDLAAAALPDHVHVDAERMLVGVFVGLHAPDKRSAEDGSRQRRAEEERAVEDGALEVRPGEIGAVETRLRQIGPRQLRLGHLGARKIRLGQIRVCEPRHFETNRFPEVASLQGRSAKIRARQIGVFRVSMGEIGVSDIGLSQRRALEMDAREIRALQNGAVEFRAPEIESA
jgi:hypothetical protein